MNPWVSLRARLQQEQWQFFEICRYHLGTCQEFDTIGVTGAPGLGFFNPAYLLEDIYIYK